MLYIVGLGNPGEKYARTRHNVGFQAVQYVVENESLPSLVSSKQFSGELSEGVLHGHEVVALLPHTYMNNSGTAVRKLVPKGEEASLVVIYDDVDLPVGEMKLSFGRGSGGHNGLASIITSLGTKDFVRIRIGVAPRSFFGIARRPTGDRLSRHVLSAFTRKEEKMLEDVFLKVRASLVTILEKGIDIAMNQHN